MRLFKKKHLKKIKLNSRMMIRYPTFYKYYEYNVKFVHAELSASDDTLLEYRFPILTFGSIMGYSYFGIEEKLENAFIYMYTVSRSGKKTKLYKIEIDFDKLIEEYIEIEKKLAFNMMQDPDFLKISVGEL